MATVLTPDEIKQKIQDWITSLGGKEITGAHLNAILSAIMDYVGVGFAFKDSAPAAAPSSDVPVVYIAGPGTYTGYEDDAVEVPQGSVCIFMYDGSDWSKSVLKILSGVDDEPTAGSNNLVKSGGVAEKIGMLKTEVDGTVSKDVIWSNGYINSSGVINSSGLSIFSQPLLLKAGEKVTVGTLNTNICIIGYTNADSLNVGDTISVIQTTSATSQFETYDYLATADIKIVLCVLASNYMLEFYNDDNLDARVKELEDNTPTLENGEDDLYLVDNNQNILALFRNGHMKTKYFDSSEVTSENQEDADVEISDKGGNNIFEVKHGHIKSKHFDSRDFKTVKSYIDKFVPEYTSAEHYNQIPIEKCGYKKICQLPIGSVYKGKVARRYEQYNYIARIALFGDPHIGYGYSFVSSGNVWKDWEDYIELSLKRASNKVPDLGIAMGDQLSSINEYLYNEGGVGLVERNDWYNRIRQFNYPLFPIFGNHDNAIPDFTHTGVIEIANVRIIVFHMDIVYTTPFSTYNISDEEYSWLENAVKDSYNKGFITVLASHYAIISDSSESVIPEEYIGMMLVQNHGQDLIDLCKTYNVRLHIHGHVHPTGLPYRLMTDNGVPFDMTEVEIGLCARAYVILEIQNDGFHFTEYPVTRSNGTTEEGGVTIRHYEVLDDAPGRTLFVPLYNQGSGTVRSDAWTPYPAGTE